MTFFSRLASRCATHIFNASGMMNGSTPTSKASGICSAPPRYTSAYQSEPIIYISSKVTDERSTLLLRISGNALSSSHHSSTARSIPIIYPPLASRSLPIPPEKPEKTGRPIAPNTRYSPTAVRVGIAPRRSSEK